MVLDGAEYVSLNGLLAFLTYNVLRVVLRLLLNTIGDYTIFLRHMLGQPFVALTVISDLTFLVHLCDRLHQLLGLQLQLGDVKVIILLVDHVDA